MAIIVFAVVLYKLFKGIIRRTRHIGEEDITLFSIALVIAFVVVVLILNIVG